MRRLPPSSLLLRLVVVLGPVAALACGALAGHPPSVTTYVVALVLSVACAARPDAWFGTVVGVGVVLWWSQALDDAVPLAVLPATAALTAAHVAALVADHGPARMAVSRDVGLLWLRRGLLAVLGAGALWGLARAVDGTRPSGVWVAAVALGTVAAGVVAVQLGLSHDAPTSPGRPASRPGSRAADRGPGSPRS